MRRLIWKKKLNIELSFTKNKKNFTKKLGNIDIITEKYINYIFEQESIVELTLKVFIKTEKILLFMLGVV